MKQLQQAPRRAQRLVREIDRLAAEEGPHTLLSELAHTRRRNMQASFLIGFLSGGLFVAVGLAIGGMA